MTLHNLNDVDLHLMYHTAPFNVDPYCLSVYITTQQHCETQTFGQKQSTSIWADEVFQTFVMCICFEYVLLHYFSIFHCWKTYGRIDE